MELTLVEQLGRELADSWREPPGHWKEETAISRNRLRAPEYVLERRDADAVRVRCLLRLVELLRIAREDQTRPRLRHRQSVRQRELAGLVNEEDVDGTS